MKEQIVREQDERRASVKPFIARLERWHVPQAPHCNDNTQESLRATLNIGHWAACLTCVTCLNPPGDTVKWGHHCSHHRDEKTVANEGLNKVK